MCLVERREAALTPLNMTLTARLPLPPTPNACVEVDLPVWSMGVACCPNCRPQLCRLTLAQPCKCSLLSPQLSSPLFTIQPTYLSQSPVPIIPTQYQDELRRLSDTLKALRLSGWYYGQLDWQGARSLLKDASVGAFIVRDSSDKNFILSLSIQTERGPTSVRLHYEQGVFRLDCDRPLVRYMPRFSSVLELVQHYRRLVDRNGEGTVWVDRDGCPHSPVLLKAPLRQGPPTLMHAARLAVHQALDSNPLTPKLWFAPKHKLLPLPSTLIDYLGEYPYTI